MKLLWSAVLLWVGSAFLVDEDNYFYINTSYHRSTRTVSLSACFHLNSTTAHAYITSPLLISAGPHKTHAVIKKGKPI